MIKRSKESVSRLHARERPGEKPPQKRSAPHHPKKKPKGKAQRSEKGGLHPWRGGEGFQPPGD